MVGDLSSTNGGKASSKDEEVILANGVGNLEFLIGFHSASMLLTWLCMQCDKAAKEAQRLTSGVMLYCMQASSGSSY